MLALESSLKKVSLAPTYHIATVATCQTSIRSYANQKRLAKLSESGIPQLDKIDSILDFPSDKLDTLNQPQLFSSRRPSEVVLNTVTNIIETPLSTSEQASLRKRALVVKRVVNMNGKGKTVFHVRTRDCR